MMPVHRRLALGVAFVAFNCVLPVAEAGPLPQTFVSAAVGSDQNPCTSSLPCRTLATALAVTEAGGLVVAMDSGVFSEKPLELKQAVTIAAAPGVEAVLQADTWGVVVVNADPDDIITLRGLTLMPAPGFAAEGIVLGMVAELHVEDCHLLGFEHGIYAMGTKARLLVRRSVVRGGYVAVYLASPMQGVFDDVTISDADFGLVTSLDAVASIRDSAIVGNGVAIQVDMGGGNRSRLTVEDCLLTHNVTGVQAGANGLVRLSGSTITNNDTGVSVGTGVVETRGNNTIRGNGRDVVGTMTAIPGR